VRLLLLELERLALEWPTVLARLADEIVGGACGHSPMILDDVANCNARRAGQVPWVEYLQDLARLFVIEVRHVV
jgi:hypothetical protein